MKLNKKGWGTVEMLLLSGGLLIALLVAVFLQTIGFWMSIPWWLYLLVVGAGMIIVAMRNEMIKNKEENNSLVSDWIEKLKEKMRD